MNTDIERIIRKLAVEPIRSVHLNSCFEIFVTFKNGRVVKQKLDLYFRLFLSIWDNVKYLQRIDEEENDEDRRAFVPDTNRIFYVLGLKNGDRFKSVTQSGIECYTRLVSDLPYFDSYNKSV